MATYDIEKLMNKYSGFRHPFVEIQVNDKSLNGKKGFPVSDVNIDLTSGYDASVAEFSIYNVFDKNTATFKYKEVETFIHLGSKVEVYAGYGDKGRCIFRGLITRVNFSFEEGEIPCIRITAMDVKGIMMSSNYSKQLKEIYYSDAVDYILHQTAYDKLANAKIIENINVAKTPDKERSISNPSDKQLDRTIEMVAESDYEFVVKAAKKNNFEFFTECGNVYFRKAKSDTSILMEIGPETGLRSFDIAYDLSGLCEKIVVRSTDVGKAKQIQVSQTFSNKISYKSKASQYIAKSEKVYIDPTCFTEEEANDRAASLMESMSYRFGSLRAETAGIPELLPGHFVELHGLGQGPDNKFYLTRVIHRMHKEGNYSCQLEGVAGQLS